MGPREGSARTVHFDPTPAVYVPPPDLDSLESGLRPPRIVASSPPPLASDEPLEPLLHWVRRGPISFGFDHTSSSARAGGALYHAVNLQLPVPHWLKANSLEQQHFEQKRDWELRTMSPADLSAELHRIVYHRIFAEEMKSPYFAYGARISQVTPEFVASRMQSRNEALLRNVYTVLSLRPVAGARSYPQQMEFPFAMEELFDGKLSVENGWHDHTFKKKFKKTKLMKNYHDFS